MFKSIKLLYTAVIMKRVTENVNKNHLKTLGRNSNFVLCLSWKGNERTFHDVIQQTLVGVEALSEVHHGELGGVPQLVAEEPVALHPKNVQVDVTAWK